MPFVPAGHTRIEASRRLASIISAQDRPLIGHVHFIHLDAVREALGAKWDRRHEQVALTARVVAQAYLGPHDFATTVRDILLVVGLPNHGTDEGIALAATIAQDLLRRFLGDNLKIGDIRIGTLREDDHGSLTATATWPYRVMIGRLGEGEAVSDDAVIEMLEAAMVATDATAPPLPDALAPAPPGPDRADPLLPRDLYFRYRQIWDVRHAALSVNLCLAACADDDLGPRRGHAAVGGSFDGPRAAALDLTTLEHAVAAVRRPLGGEGVRLFAIPVAARTLERQTPRRLYLERLGSLTEAERRLIIFDVLGLEGTAAAPRLFAVASLLRPFARSLCVRLKPGEHIGAPFAHAGLQAVGLDVGGLGVEAAVARIEAFGQEAARRKLRAYVYGIDSRAALSAAFHAGFAYIAGEAVAVEAAQPAAARALTSADLRLSELRREDRQAVDIPVVLEVEGRRQRGRLIDLSRTGANFVPPVELPVGHLVSLRFGRRAPTLAAEVMSCDRQVVNLHFGISAEQFERLLAVDRPGNARVR